MLKTWAVHEEANEMPGTIRLLYKLKNAFSLWLGRSVHICHELTLMEVSIVLLYLRFQCTIYPLYLFIFEIIGYITNMGTCTCMWIHVSLCVSVWPWMPVMSRKKPVRQRGWRGRPVPGPAMFSPPLRTHLPTSASPSLEVLKSHRTPCMHKGRNRKYQLLVNKNEIPYIYIVKPLFAKESFRKILHIKK